MQPKSIILHGLLAGSLSSAEPLRRRQDGPVDPTTTKDCTFFDTAFDEKTNCAYFEDTWNISHEEFVAWNPSVKEDCSAIKVGNSYCVEGPKISQPPSTSTIKPGTPTTTSSNPPVDTCNPNAPDKVQPGATCGCTKWHLVKNDKTTCAAIIQYEKISTEDFYFWNPGVGKDCSTLWVGYNVCVAGPGAHPPSTTTTTTPPAETCNPGAPQPVQPGAVCGCNKWHLVKSSSTTCDAIIKYDKIAADDFYKWNPKVGRDCKNLWVGYNVCVGGPGAKPPASTTTTTKPPAPTCHPDAPQPVQPGAVCNCKKWHFVKNKDTTCDAIIKYEHISANDFYKWNPKVGRDCAGLWLGYYVCVGV